MNRHLHDDFDNFLAGVADVQCSMYGYLQLRSGITKRFECCNTGNFAGLEIEGRTRVDSSKRKSTK
jgi:hypothetical protein